MKKKILMLTVAACLIVLSIAGTSLAYFTDTDTKTNVFTAGNVAITLDYNEVNQHLYPGQTYSNTAATITNVGSEEAYVGAIIELTVANFENVTDKAAAYATIISAFPGLAPTSYEVTATGYKIYVVVADELASSANTTVFNNVTIPATWDHAEMNLFNRIDVKITAYATQTVGFDTAAQALAAAFPAVWANN